jgi:hypothetical protein
MSRFVSVGHKSTERIVLACSPYTVALPPRTSCISKRPGICPNPVPTPSARHSSVAQYAPIVCCTICAQRRIRLLHDCAPACLITPSSALLQRASRWLNTHVAHTRKQAHAYSRKHTHARTHALEITCEEAVAGGVEADGGQETYVVLIARVHLPPPTCQQPTPTPHRLPITTPPSALMPTVLHTSPCIQHNRVETTNHRPAHISPAVPIRTSPRRPPFTRYLLGLRPREQPERRRCASATRAASTQAWAGRGA